MVHSSLSMNQCHLYAQKLNNSAALCIEIGHYDRAIFSLTKALRLSREQSDESMMCGCHCAQCSLDGCIAYSESSPPVANLSPQSPMEKNTHCGYVYQRPIRIPPQPILENHNMGRTLFLIVTFNLAMAHHLSALATRTRRPPSPTTSGAAMESREESTSTSTSTTTNSSQQKAISQAATKKIKTALQLYEVSDNWHTRITASRPPSGHDCDVSQVSGPSSIRFKMILSNNLSHVHRLSSNYAEHKQCLEHLLSTVMVAVEYKTRVNQNSNSNNSSDSLSSSSTTTSSSSQENCDLCTTNLEGFLMNASQLFLARHCADAA